MKDWTGNKKPIFITLGASSHSSHEREENDFYATDPLAIDLLFSLPMLYSPHIRIYEPACGDGHLASRITELRKDIQI
ncbi:MAG: hypothetical protein ACRC5H_06495, partial [Treponemataceae bacterium]